MSKAIIDELRATAAVRVFTSETFKQARVTMRTAADQLSSLMLEIEQLRQVNDPDPWAKCDHMTTVPRGLQDREGCED